jgi:hypothetical protein
LGPQIVNLRSATSARKSIKLLKSTNLRICDLWNLFADRPPLIDIPVLLEILKGKLSENVGVGFTTRSKNLMLELNGNEWAKCLCGDIA